MTYDEFLQTKIDIAEETGFEIDPAEVNPALHHTPLWLVGSG